MWMLYVLMAMLSASIVVKLARPLRHDARARWLAGAVVLLPVMALALYHALGRPDMKGAPRVFTAYEREDRNAALLATRPMQQLLSKNAEDLGALISLGQINYRLGKFDAAARYFAQGRDIARRDGDWRLRIVTGLMGESLVEANDGKVSEDARDVFLDMRGQYDKSPLARHYLALYKAQNGQEAEAIADWNRLLGEGDHTIYWKARVREAMSATRETLRLEAEKDKAGR